MESPQLEEKPNNSQHENIYFWYRYLETWRRSSPKDWSFTRHLQLLLTSFLFMFWSLFFSTNQMAYIQIISVSFFGAVHVSWHFLLCSLEMLDIDPSPCAMTHSLKEAGRAVTSSCFLSSFTLIYCMCLWAHLHTTQVIFDMIPERLSVKRETKKSLRSSAFSLTFVTRYTKHIFPSLPLVVDVPGKPF